MEISILLFIRINFGASSDFGKRKKGNNQREESLLVVSMPY